MNIELLVICEGKTDQILLGSYIEHISEWKYVGVIKNNPFPKEKSINWYTRDDECYLAIWENSGSYFPNVLKKICEREKAEHVIRRLLVVSDHDDENSEDRRMKEVFDTIQKALGCEYKEELSAQKWNQIWWNGDFGSCKSQVGYLLVPYDENGALESFMLRCLKENDAENEYIIEQVDVFLNSLKSEKYLTKRRERVKARLGVSLGIIAPDRSFDALKEIIDSVDWSKYDEANVQFSMIRSVIV